MARTRVFFERAGLVIGLIVLTISIFGVQPSFGIEPSQVQIAVNVGSTIGVNNFSLGFQLDGRDISQWLDRPVLQELSHTANFRLVRFFEHRLGYTPCRYWNESTGTGRWYWSDVDSLVRKIFQIGAQPLIVLGFYSWVAEGITSAPLGMTVNATTGLPYPLQWGNYCATWVSHFRAVGLPVKYYEIVNEPFHYFGSEYPDTTKVRYYIELYNAASVAMRIQNPDVRIGSDGSIFKKVLQNFINFGEPLDFISFHRYGTNELKVTNDEILNAAETKYMYESYARYAPGQASEIYFKARGLKLPVIMSEGNVNSASSDGTDPRTRQMLGAVYTALTSRTFILNNILFNVYFTFGSSGTEGIGMVNVDTNKAWYPYYAQQIIGQNLEVGDILVETLSSSEDVRSLAWVNNEKLKVLLINKVDAQRTVYLVGISGEINFSKIDNTISWSNAQIQNGVFDSSDPIVMNGYTVMLLQTDPSRQEDLTLLLEDDFETGDFRKWTGTRSGSGDSLTVTSIDPYAGTYHAQFVTDGNGYTESAYCYRTLDESEIFARGYFKIASGLPLIDVDDRFYLIQMMSNGNLLAGVCIRRNNYGDSWATFARNGSDWIGPVFSTSPTVVTDTWYRVELHWKKHSQTGTVQAFVNGQSVVALTGLGTSTFGNITEVDFGTISIGVQAGLNVHGDRFALSRSYIGERSRVTWNPADINNDGKVDIKDVSFVTVRFGITPSHQLWDPVADLNGDNKIDTRDVSTVTKHCGEVAP